MHENEEPRDAREPGGNRKTRPVSTLRCAPARRRHALGLG